MTTNVYSADRGFFSQDNIQRCKGAGVEIVRIPLRGGKKTPAQEAFEESRTFKGGQRFRAGIEGRISVLFRGRGMKRRFADDRERFELLLDGAVPASNLMVVARLMIEKRKRRRRQAA